MRSSNAAAEAVIELDAITHSVRLLRHRVRQIWRTLSIMRSPPVGATESFERGRYDGPCNRALRAQLSRRAE